MDSYELESIKDILMRRDGNTAEEAEIRIEDCQANIDEGLAGEWDILEMESIIADHFGLEPDYLTEFL